MALSFGPTSATSFYMLNTISIRSFAVLFVIC